MPRLTFKLHKSSVAMQSETDQRNIITIPANASVTLVAGDIHGKGVVQVRYRDQPLQMLAIDLRTRGILELAV